MAKSKYLTDEQIIAALQPLAEQVKLDMKMISKSAIAAFYADYRPLHGYVRTYGFYNLIKPNMRCKETIKGSTISLVFDFDSFDVQVSQDGDPDWAFDSGFISGFHGGPHNMGNRTYSWTPVPKMKKSPWDIITDYVNRKY